MCRGTGKRKEPVGEAGRQMLSMMEEAVMTARNSMKRRLGTTPEQTRQRCRQELQDWMAQGHSEAALRKLARATAWAVAPAPMPPGKV